MKFSKEFLKPNYTSNSFVDIVPKIRDILINTKEYNKVILILLDAFGWCFFEKYKNDYPFLKRFIEKGTVSKLLSQFPSTTAAHITTIHTGLPVNEHGVYEWRYYEPEVDNVIIPLKFSFSKHKKRGTLKSTGVHFKDIYPTINIHNEFNSNKIKSYDFLDGGYINSPYNETVSKGMESVPYIDLTNGLKSLANLLTREKNKSYYYFYYDKIDNIAHKYGPNSKELKKELDSCFNSLEKFFSEIDGKTDKTLLMITADHGQTETDPKTTIYLNKVFPQIRRFLKRNKKGELLVPSGSCRDMFLYAKDEFIDELKSKLETILKDKAEVYKTKELLNLGYFGLNNSSEDFLKRLGNLVVLPYRNQSVWWYKKGVFEQRHYGNHGGLTKEEMEIPLLTLGLN